MVVYFSRVCIELRHSAIGLQFYRPMATTNLINFGVSLSESIAERMHRPRYEWDLTILIYYCRLPGGYTIFKFCLCFYIDFCLI